jgi:hypothetical protein
MEAKIMAKQTSTGITLGVIAETPATFDDAGFSALTYQDVGEVIDIPEFGPNIQVVESNPLATGITEKRPGFANYGSVSIGLEYDPEDAGQQILEAAVDPGGEFIEHSFKLSYSDGTVEYFVGGVFSYTRAPGSANSMVGSTAQVEINSKIVRVLPTP